MSSRIANGLIARGIKPGDHIALTCPNIVHFPAIYYGILKAGAVVVPLNVLCKPAEIAYFLRDSDAVAYFCFEGTPELPMARMGHQAFAEVDACKHFITVTVDPLRAGRSKPSDASDTRAKPVTRRDAVGPDEGSGRGISNRFRRCPDDTAVILLRRAPPVSRRAPS